MSSEHAMCAHLKVEYKPVEHDNGTNSDRWVCSLCGGDFWPQHWLFPAPWLAAETAERTENAPPPAAKAPEQDAMELAQEIVDEFCGGSETVTEIIASKIIAHRQSQASGAPRRSLGK